MAKEPHPPQPPDGNSGRDAGRDARRNDGSEAPGQGNIHRLVHAGPRAAGDAVPAVGQPAPTPGQPDPTPGQSGTARSQTPATAPDPTRQPASPAIARATGPLWTATPLAERPIRLLTPPEEVRVLYAIPEGPPAQFIWRHQTLRITRHTGPERIAPEWWQDRPGTRLRDYFKIEDHTGRRLWIFREGLVHDGRGGIPRWFLHGVFA